MQLHITEAQDGAIPLVIEIASTDGIALPSLVNATDTAVDESAYVWFTAEEDGGPNTGVFTATDLDDDSIVKIAGNAPRDAAAIITYDGTDSGILIKHSEATIDIQSPDDVWTSGLAIPIVMVDGDVNKNSPSAAMTLYCLIPIQSFQHWLQEIHSP